MTPPLVIFQHLAKTGGTTLAEILVRNFPADRRLDLVPGPTVSALGTYSIDDVRRAAGALSPERRDALQLVGGHLGFGVQALFRRPAKYFTLVRDPVDRLLSAFYYSVPEGRTRSGEPVTLEDYVFRRRPLDLGLNNGQARVISGLSDLDPIGPFTTENTRPLTEADFDRVRRNLDQHYLLVGVTDRFDEFLVVLCRRLGWRLSDAVYVRRNVTAGRPRREEIAAEIVAELERQNAFDRRLYALAHAMLSEAIEALGPSFPDDLERFRRLNRAYQSGVPLADLRRSDHDRPGEVRPHSPRIRATRPTVSILLCNYNDERYLPESLGAICGQSLPPDEVIVVDDGSTDGSVDVIEAVAARHPFVRVLRNNPNRGLLFSIRRALDQASGDYVVWAAADDRLGPSFLERSLAVLVRYPGAGVCFSRLAVFDDETHAVREYLGDGARMAAFDMGAEPHFLSPEDLRARLKRSYLWMSGNTVLARRDALLEAGGFRPELRWHADWFAYYVVALRHGACVVPETLAFMRERPRTFSKVGMGSPAAQHMVLGAIAAVLREPDHRDIARAFRTRPCLLSLFGRPMLRALAADPRDWPLALRCLRWRLHYHGAFHLNRLRTRTGRVLRRCASAVGARTPSAWKS